MVNSSGQYTPASSDTSILKFQPSCTHVREAQERHEVTQKKDIYSCQMRLLGGVLIYFCIIGKKNMMAPSLKMMVVVRVNHKGGLSCNRLGA